MGKITGFSRKSYPEIVSRVKGDLIGSVPGADSLAELGGMSGIAQLIARSEHDLGAHLAYIARHAMPLFAEGVGLDDWGALFLIPRLEATRASGVVSFPAEAGSVIGVDVTLRSDSGVLYKPLSAGAEAGGYIQLSVRAIEPGKAGNLVSGRKVRLISPVAGVESSGEVITGGLVGGADRELDGGAGVYEHYRARVMARIQRPPAGGNAFDYERWAREVAGVTDAWAVPEAYGAGSVQIIFVMDEVRAEFAGVPQGDPGPVYSGDLKSVYDYVMGGAARNRAPVGARVFIDVPVLQPIDVEIAGLEPASLEVKTAIEAELKDLMQRNRTPGKLISFSWIDEAVSVATGERRHKITSPVDDIQLGPVVLPSLGVITYV
ncbi:baseplate J/gp47 family protein [Kiloniella laminariae]|uniref:baseplate J/gp47 family protein n=1 Tax=Kiloniella laminariae TaxID=454162 RepID=UPI000368C4F9|nr:baseplate J/gp47 family protein [Kiloniella laminariae]